MKIPTISVELIHVWDTRTGYSPPDFISLVNVSLTPPPPTFNLLPLHHSACPQKNPSARDEFSSSFGSKADLYHSASNGKWGSEQQMTWSTWNSLDHRGRHLQPSPLTLCPAVIWQKIQEHLSLFCQVQQQQYLWVARLTWTCYY